MGIKYEAERSLEASENFLNAMEKFLDDYENGTICKKEAGKRAKELVECGETYTKRSHNLTARIEKISRHIDNQNKRLAKLGRRWSRVMPTPEAGNTQ